MMNECVPLSMEENINRIELVSSRASLVKTTLKNHLQENLQLQSDCSFNCPAFALSGEKEFNAKCSSHDHHIEQYGYCNEFDHMKKLSNLVIRNLIHDSGDLYSRAEPEFEVAMDSIDRYHSHLIHEFHQSQVQQSILFNLPKDTCYIVCDRAMKFLTSSHREKQSEWFPRQVLIGTRQWSLCLGNIAKK